MLEEGELPVVPFIVGLNSKDEEGVLVPNRSDGDLDMGDPPKDVPNGLWRGVFLVADGEWSWRAV